MYKDECSQGGPNTSEESGTYQSKNYPRDYPNNLNINKTISVTNGKKIKITFLDFQLEDRWFNEIYDFITITDGNGELLLDKTYGENKPDEIVSRTNKIILWFKTDGYVPKKGFKLRWESVVEVEETKTIKSRGYPGLYPNYLTQRDVIEVPAGKIISMKFLSFSIEKGNKGCNYDNVTIVDNNGSDILPPSCGDDGTIPKIPDSFTNKAFLIFKTDYSQTRKGFLLQYGAK